MPNVRKERKGKRVIIDNRRFILYKRSSFKYIYIHIFLCWFLNVILYNGENEKRRYKEKPYKWVEQVKIRKRRFLARSIDSVIHGTEMELGVQLNMFLSLKSLPLLFRFYYFVFFFFSLLFFFLIQQIPEGERKEVFTSNPPRNVTLTMQMKNSPLFTGPRHFLTVPLTSTRRITVRQVTNESCIIFTARSRISRKMSRGHYPRHFFLFFFFSSPSRFFSLQATHAWDFHWF